MLDLALNHEAELKAKMRNTWFNEKYRFYHGSNCSDLCLSAETWNDYQFVSVNSKGEVIGYIRYQIDRTANYCYGFGAINFSDDTLTFGIDLRRAVTDIFNKFNFNKINFNTVIGNPAEKSYDKLIKKYGGRIVGIFHDDFRGMDGKLYDTKCYEILKRDFKQETADVALAVHGYWKKSDIPCEEYCCSVCGGGAWYYGSNNRGISKICPNCGAIMDKEAK